MPIWAMIYLGIILFFGIASIFYYKNRGIVFVVGEIFSLIFTTMILLYFFHISAKPKDSIVILAMLVYIIYWEFIANKDIYTREIQKEAESKIEIFTMIGISVLLFLPIIYMAINSI